MKSARWSGSHYNNMQKLNDISIACDRLNNLSYERYEQQGAPEYRSSYNKLEDLQHLPIK